MSSDKIVIRPGQSNLVVRARPIGAPESEAMVVANVLSDGTRVPVSPYPQATTYEEKLGQRNWMQHQGDRLFSPEDSNSDLALVSPEDWFATAGGAVRGIIPIDGNVTISQSDYNVLSNLQYLRDAAALLGAVGRNDQSTYALSMAASGVGTFQQFSSPNMLLGLQIEWGLSMLNATSFYMTVATSNFEGQYGQDVNRQFTLRMTPQPGAASASGIFQFLFANRTSGTSAGYHYNGLGGMNRAVIQPAVLGDIDDTVVNAPLLTITVPAALYSYVTIAARPITAASPALANLRERCLELLSGV